MKKIILSCVLAGLSLSFHSCRETTERKTEEAIESIGEDIERNTERAVEEIEEGAENLEREIERERHEIDDANSRESNDPIE